MKMKTAMKSIARWTLALLLVAVAATSASAQRRGGPGGGGGRMGGFGPDLISLANQASVQKELSFSEDQAKGLKELAEKQRGSFGELRDLSPDDRQKKMLERSAANTAAVAAVLKPEQLTRLKQITLQQQGAFAYSRPEVAEALQLTSEQKEKIKTIGEEARGQMRDAFGGGDRDEARKKLEAARTSTSEKLQAVLTDEQKTKWKELVGAPFTGQLERPDFGGGRGRGEGRRRDRD